MYRLLIVEVNEETGAQVNPPVYKTLFDGVQNFRNAGTRGVRVSISGVEIEGETLHGQLLLTNKGEGAST